MTVCGRGRYIWGACVRVDMDIDLSDRDVKFLQMVREINDHPDKFDGTEQGAMPASTRSLRKALDLSRRQIRYRMGGSSCRGLAEAGLTTVHEATFNEDSGEHGPKSIELTEEGLEHLTEIENETGGPGSVTPSDIEELHDRIERLEESSLDGEGEIDTTAVVDELRALRSRVEAMEEEVESVASTVSQVEADMAAVTHSTWGALDEEVATDIQKTLRRAPAMFYAFNSVFSIGIEEIADEGAYSEDELRSVQRSLFFELADAADVEIHPQSDQSTVDSEAELGQ